MAHLVEELTGKLGKALVEGLVSGKETVFKTGSKGVRLVTKIPVNGKRYQVSILAVEIGSGNGKKPNNKK